MGIIQNIADWFYLKTGRTSKVYPVTVEKHRVKGDEIVFDGIDRGRTLIDSNGRKKFDLMNESNAEGKVNYEDFQKTMDGENYAAVLMVDRDKFVPLKKEYNLDKSTYLSDREEKDFDVDKNSLQYTLSVSTFLEWADEHIEQSWKIAETQDKKWWQTEQAKWAIIMVSTGLFFIFLAVANGEFYLKPFTEQMSGLEQALNSAGSELGGS